MKVRIVYCSMANHFNIPPGRMVSFRVESEAQVAALVALHVDPVSVWNSMAPGMAVGKAKVTEPIEATPEEIASWYHLGTKTIDIQTGKLCSDPDSPRQAASDFDNLIRVGVENLCKDMSVTKEQVQKSMRRSILNG